VSSETSHAVPGGRETWYRRLANYDTLAAPFRLRRAIQKSVTIHRHIMTLIRFACSPRLRKLIGDPKLQVIPVHNQTPLSEKMPSNREEWEQLRENIYQRYVPKDPDLRDKKKEKAAIDRLVGMKELIVHCECALVSYLHRHRDASYPAFSYIGVSKLSCKPCHLWLSAYNLHAKAGRYRTKGSHDKWYLGWKTPLLDANTQAKVDEALVREVEKEYTEKEKARRAQAKKRIRSVSDSANSSEADNFHVVGAEKMNSPRFEKVEDAYMSSVETLKNMGSLDEL
jgi:hypothetical protein